jgi:hypothetical protein
MTSDTAMERHTWTVYDITRHDIPVVVTGTHCAEAQLEALFRLDLLGSILIADAMHALSS